MGDELLLQQWQLQWSANQLLNMWEISPSFKKVCVACIAMQSVAGSTDSTLPLPKGHWKLHWMAKANDTYIHPWNRQKQMVESSCHGSRFDSLMWNWNINIIHQNNYKPVYHSAATSAMAYILFCFDLSLHCFQFQQTACQYCKYTVNPIAVSVYVAVTHTSDHS